jgi:hypothetical protein
MPQSPSLRQASILCVCLVLNACTPTLDWREVRPAQSDLKLMFPCRPETQARAIALAGSSVTMQMLTCQAGTWRYALSSADVLEPSRVAPALQELRSSTARNWSGTAQSAGSFKLSGFRTPLEGTRLALSGQFPDGRPAVVESAFFAIGTRVFQAAVVGPRAGGDAGEVFFNSIAAAR